MDIKEERRTKFHMDPRFESSIHRDSHHASLLEAPPQPPPQPVAPTPPPSLDKAIKENIGSFMHAFLKFLAEVD